MIVGKNASGKSTLLDALCFVLFGKAFRNINKPTLINSVNEKNCLVEVEFEAYNKEYKVRRGIKPNVFEIWCSGTLLNQDSKSADYQDYLEKFILKMTYKSFTQIVILGSAAFTPFMQLKPADRRAVIEDLLDIQVFSIMNDIVKSRFQVLKESLEKNRISSIGKEEKKSIVERTIKTLEENAQVKKQDLSKSLKELEAKKEILTKSIEKKNKEINTLKNDIVDKSKIQSKYNKLIILKSQIESKKEAQLSDIDFFHTKDKCPTCRQTIASGFKKEEIDKLSAKLPEFDKGIKDIQSLMEQNLKLLEQMEIKQTELSETQTNLARKESDLESINRNIDTIQKTIDSLQQSDSALQENEKELVQTNKEIDILNAEKQQLLSDRVMIETAITLLKDGGIKTKIIKQYLPVINTTINKYLQQMGFFVNFTINENFEESILSRYRDSFSYENFSQGEKMKIDIALLLTWRAIAKSRNSISTNLLIMDEVFDSSLDPDATDALMTILKSFDPKTNIFIISHKGDSLLDKFDKVYTFEKMKNFSVMKE